MKISIIRDLGDKVDCLGHDYCTKKWEYNYKNWDNQMKVTLALTTLSFQHHTPPHFGGSTNKDRVRVAGNPYGSILQWKIKPVKENATSPIKVSSNKRHTKSCGRLHVFQDV